MFLQMLSDRIRSQLATVAGYHQMIFFCGIASSAIGRRWKTKRQIQKQILALMNSFQAFFWISISNCSFIDPCQLPSVNFHLSLRPTVKLT